MNASSPLPRPSADFYQTPEARSKAAEIMTIGILSQFVKKGVFSEEEAEAMFGNKELIEGINNSHQVGMLLAHWRDVFKWRLKLPSASAKLG
jgi:hypothetical protein